MSNSNILVMKHGSSVVENGSKIGINQHKVSSHMLNHVYLRKSGLLTVEVASGAVVKGKQYVRDSGQDLTKFDDTTLAKLGTYGQMSHWQEAAKPHGILVEQVLATHKEIDDASEGKFIIEGIRKSAADGILCVVNENAAAADEEMKQYEKTDPADNDWMAAHLAISVGASTLLLLTNRNGLIVEGEVIPELKVANISDILQYCNGSSESGTGGMASKVQAAGKAAQQGIEVIIANAFTDVRHIMNGDEGTRVVQ